MQGHGRIVAPNFCVARREANSGLSTLNRTKSILSIYHQQRQLQKQRGMCLNDTYPFCQQPLSGNCHSICFSKPVLWTATPVTASPCQPPLGKGALGTGDADCHSQCAHWLRNDIVFCKECGTNPGGSSGRPTPTHRLSIELRRGRRPRRPVCTSPHICVGRRALTPPLSRKKTRGKPRFPPARTQNYLSAATDLTTLTSRPL